jgi:peptidyl-prolyl cis-trans isomerase C
MVAACGETRPEDPVIVEIGEHQVMLSQFQNYIASIVEDQAPFAQGEVKAELLDQFIEEKLLLLAADEEGITVGASELDALAETVDPEVPVSGSDGTQKSKARSNLESHLRVRRLIDGKVLKDIHIAEEEIAAYYETNRAYYKLPEAVDVSQILVETETEANEIREKLATQPKSFEQLARERSIGPESVRDGNMGTFRRGELPPSFENEVFGLKKGRLSDVVETDFGFHIFRVDDVRGSKDLSLEEVADTIRIELMRHKSDEAMAGFLDGLKRRYPVKVHVDALDFPYLDRQSETAAFPPRES